MAVANSTRNTILEVLSGTPNVGLAAKARAVYRTQRFITGSHAPESLRKWSEKAEAEIKQASTNYKSVQHPADVPATGVERKIDKLSPSDLVWLQKLPTDPGKIPFQDAVRLGHLNRSLGSLENPSDANLIASMWGPVKEHHDRRQAEALAHNAKLTSPNLLLESINALSDIIKQEMPTLSESAVEEEARHLIRQAEAKRQANTQKLLANADAILAAANESETKRTALIND